MPPRVLVLGSKEGLPRLADQENELVGKAVAGDPEALEILLERNADWLADRISIPARWRAELSKADVLQETFTDAFLKIHTLQGRGEAHLRRWLAKLALHNVLDAKKALETAKRGGGLQRAQLEGDGRPGLAGLAASSTGQGTPSRSAAQGEGCERVRSAVDRLGEPHRTVVRMYDLERQSIECVTRAIGRTAGAVYMIRKRALGQLRTSLGRSSAYFTK